MARVTSKSSNDDKRDANEGLPSGGVCKITLSLVKTMKITRVNIGTPYYPATLYAHDIFQQRFQRSVSLSPLDILVKIDTFVWVTYYPLQVGFAYFILLYGYEKRSQVLHHSKMFLL